MNFIWEMEVTDKSYTFYRQAEEFSPYFEQCSPYLNHVDGKKEVSFNSFFRFEHIFSALFSKDCEKEMGTRVRDYLFDILVHDLISMDLRTGLSGQEYFLEQLKDSLEAGEYGKEAGKKYLALSKENQETIVLYLLKQYQVGASIGMFGEVLYRMFQGGVLYTNKLEKKKLLYYAGIKRGQEAENQIELIQRLFLPLDYQIRIFWEGHFGILGEPETMEWGKIEIY